MLPELDEYNRAAHRQQLGRGRLHTLQVLQQAGLQRRRPDAGFDALPVEAHPVKHEDELGQARREDVGVRQHCAQDTSPVQRGAGQAGVGQRDVALAGPREELLGARRTHYKTAVESRFTIENPNVA